MLQGKLDTEKLLTDKGITFTSVRPVYIYGPLNYNPVEEWFFHRIKAGRPIPVPNSGQQVSLVSMCTLGTRLQQYCFTAMHYQGDHHVQQLAILSVHKRQHLVNSLLSGNRLVTFSNAEDMHKSLVQSCARHRVISFGACDKC